MKAGAQVIAVGGGLLREFAWPACGVAAVLALFVLTGWLDGRDGRDKLAAEMQRMYELGRQQGHAEMVASAEAAWAAAAQVQQARCERAGARQ